MVRLPDKAEGSIQIHRRARPGLGVSTSRLGSNGRRATSQRSIDVLTPDGSARTAQRGLAAEGLRAVPAARTSVRQSVPPRGKLPWHATRRPGRYSAFGSSTKTSTAMSGSMWLVLMKAITLRSMASSTTFTRSSRISF
jgi:hypothetical protein